MNSGCVHFITLSVLPTLQPLLLPISKPALVPRQKLCPHSMLTFCFFLPLARGLLLWVSMALTTLRTPWEWFTQCSCHSAVSWRMSWTAPGVRIPSFVKSERFTHRWPSAFSESWHQGNCQVSTTLGQILHGALKEHSRTLQVHSPHSIPSVSFSCPVSSATQGPEYKAE